MMILHTRLAQVPLLRHRFGRVSFGLQRRPYSEETTAAGLSVRTENAADSRDGWLFVDSVFPIQIAKWDIRHYLGLVREEYLLDILQSQLEHVGTHDFKIISLQPHEKDGGVFVRFTYRADDPEDALKSIQSELTEVFEKHGGVPSWLGLNKGKAWMVKGTPWREDMDRYASPIVKVVFEGPDLQEQSLYQLFRPFGHIKDLTLPVTVSPGTLRSSTITFSRLHSATIARNVLHGLHYSPDNSTGKTCLRTAYQRPVQAHAVRDWMSSHPKIMLPLLVFLLGSLTYTVFDPIRSLMIQGKILDWFDYREYRLYKWLRTNAFDRFSLTSNPASIPVALSVENVWRERGEAVGSIRSYLSDFPTTIEFVYGPQGSGKTRMLEALLEESGRKAIIIDCRSLQNTTSDSQMVAALAVQTGYWPVFTFLNSMNSLIDLASIGLIGQKAGLSNSLDDQLRQILTVVGTALKGVSSTHRAAIKRRIQEKERKELQNSEEDRIVNEIRRGTWHDGRLDCIAGNGVMSELGIGDEPMLDSDAETGPTYPSNIDGNEEKLEVAGKQRTQEEIGAVRALPIVIIRNYAAKVGSKREELLTVLAQWAATLAENQVAHVIVLSDNRENAKRIAKALPSKPLNLIALSDADSRSSVSFVQQKLRDSGVNAEFTPKQVVYVERLGGRASDLEILVHKVRNGQAVEDAVENIISRGVAELRKNAFGDDVDDAKTLPWTREQVWVVLKLLSKREEVPYHDILVEFPFKGDETALRSMEHAELISIGTHDGRPSTIRPGKPVLRWAFERLVDDLIFRATQEIAMNEKIILLSEKKIAACEDELVTLTNITSGARLPWWQFGFGAHRGTSVRSRYLAEKLATYSKKIGVLEKKNTELKKVLAKGDS